ncbi:TolC family protein [uncultured Prevotella sp.]|jgi:outer membrane protein TolC|uniref:TolC family protein n=1 Tax=uncultured Prevotella sp. TaxID=159272 RepID=UPI0027E32E6E|nr:TolC family protein [uncultured Prevotella sp.]
MKRYLIATIVAFSTYSIALADNIGDVLKQVASNNLTLKALAHDNQADVLDIKASNSIGGPSVEYSPFFTKGYSGVAESELVVSQEIDFPTKYAARNKQAKMQNIVGEQLLIKQRRDILLQAQLLCIDLIRLNQTLSMLHERLANSETLLQMYQKRMDAGDANALELNKVKLDCMEVRTLVNEAQGERTSLLQQLRQLNGGKPIDVIDTVLPEYPQITNFESYRALALASDADVAVAQTALRAADMNLKLQKNEWLPNISFGYRRNTEQGEGINGFLVGVSFPLYSNSNNVKAARQRRESAELQVMQAQNEAEATLRTNYEQLQGLQQVIDHSDVKLLQESLTLFAKALQQGEITALVYYVEINSIYEKLQRHIDLHCQSVKLLAELHKAEL